MEACSVTNAEQRLTEKIQVTVKKVPIAVDRATSGGGAADMKAQIAQAEQIRLAEERMRIEQARKEYESRIAEDLARKKKRRKKTVTIVVLLVIVPLLVCGVIFFGIPYFNYQSAQNALANGKYDTAYHFNVKVSSAMTWWLYAFASNANYIAPTDVHSI